MMYFNGTRNDRRRATGSRGGKLFSGKERAQKMPNWVEFANCSNHWTHRKQTENTNGDFFASGVAGGLGQTLGRRTELRRAL